MAQRRVVDAVAAELAAAGVRRLYGMPGGGSNMSLIGAAAEHGIDFVLVHHEPAAVFAAAGEAETTGRPTVCIATLGPGVANSVNGLAHCLLDRVPVLLFSDSPGAAEHRHQRLAHDAVVGGVVKASVELSPGSAAATVRAALAEAACPPPGPIHLGLSNAVATAPAGDDDADPCPCPLGARRPSGEGSVADAAALLERARRPVVLAGLEAAEPEAAAAVRSFVERLNAPLLTTYKGKGILPEDHPQTAGLVTNGAIEARVLDEADAIVAVGLDEVELMPGPWRWRRPTVVIGREAGGARHVTADVALTGDPASLVPQLEASLDGWTTAWNGGLPTARPTRDETTARERTGLTPVDVVIAARAVAPAGTVATVDAGSHMFAATLFWAADAPRRFLISNGLSTMGYALPAAIGASLALPDALAVCFTGDGGLAMVAGELETLARLQAQVIVVVFNDAELNLIKIKQEKRGETTRGLDFGAIDWVAVARGMGVAAERVARDEELGPAFARATSAGGPYLVEAVIDRSSYPRLLDVIRG